MLKVLSLLLLVCGCKNVIEPLPDGTINVKVGDKFNVFLKGNSGVPYNWVIVKDFDGNIAKFLSESTDADNKPGGIYIRKRTYKSIGEGVSEFRAEYRPNVEYSNSTTSHLYYTLNAVK